MKTLFISLTSIFPLETTERFISMKYDLDNDIIYEVGSELSYLVKDNSLADKTLLLTDYKKDRPQEFKYLEHNVLQNIKHTLLQKLLPEEIEISFPQEYIKWLTYHPNNLYSAIGNKLSETNKITISTIEMYDEYIKERVIRQVLDIIQQTPHISNFTIVDNIDANSRIVNDILKLSNHLKFSSFPENFIQYNLGKIFFEGYGVKKNIDISIKCFETSSIKGNGSASNFLGEIYQKGEVVQKNHKKAIQLYNKGIEQGNYEAYLNLGYYYEKGIEVEKDVSKAVILYEKACQNGIMRAHKYLANIYYEGTLGEPDYSKSLFHYNKLKDNLENFIDYYRIGKIISKLEEENKLENALPYFQKAIDKGSLLSLYYAARMLEDECDKVNIKKAFKLYEKAVNISYNDLLNNKETDISEEEFYQNVYEGYVRTSDTIADSFLTNNTHIKHIKINENVKIIGKGAFRNCIHLETIELPESILAIEDYAFMGCLSLKSINLPKKIKRISDYLFADCINLDNIIFSSDISEIGLNSFANCYTLKTILLNNKLKSIRKFAFQNCNSLNYLEIPNSVKLLDSAVFWGCVNIKSVILPSDIDKISKRLFWGCKSLENINIPESVIEIEDYGFYNCSSLTQIKLPTNLVIIKDYAFFKCESLKKINLPSSVIYLGKGIFKDCSQLEFFKFSNNLKISIDSIDLLCKANLLNEKKKSLINSRHLRYSYVLREELFANCKNLKELTLPYYIVEIKSYAFEGCIGLEKVIVIDNMEGEEISSLTYNLLYILNAYVFKDCNNIKSFIIPESVFICRSPLFYDCLNLNTITINSLILDNDGCELFIKCDNLKNLFLLWDFKKLDSNTWREKIYNLLSSITSLENIYVENNNVKYAKLLLPKYSDIIKPARLTETEK